ncbi:hypothetical protein [Idiomarina sp.]|uniref:hypothetical protein n=1 Tax=Idiomarina sp. TaxID=1874361 RepID=UPI0025C44225|nr:hypothetical protein [Idiomarina sp.]
MAFEKCPKCEDEVLDNKYSCPACGYVKSENSEQKEQPGENDQPGESKITTENTSKSLQVQGVLAIVILIIGVLWFFLTSDDGYTDLMVDGVKVPHQPLNPYTLYF